MVKEEEEELSIQTQIEQAVTSRIQHFKDNAESLTMGSVRRLLEKDMGLETNALDAHKKFIKSFVEKRLEDNNDVSPDAVTKAESANTVTKESETPKENETTKDPSDPVIEDEPKMEDSPIMGLMTTTSDLGDAKSTGASETSIKKAVRDRASHIIDNSETITMVSLRRLLEEDMGLPTYSLDPFKSFIRSQIDEVLESPKVSKPTPSIKKTKTPSMEKKTSKAKSSPAGSEDDKIKSRKKAVGSRGSKDVSNDIKKRKGAQKETQISNKKLKTLAKSPSDDGDNTDEDSDGQSESSAGKNAKAKQVSTPAYGKKVENLKSLIKACGLGIAPTVYKRARLLPDEEREAFVITELKGILSREGLSTNPTEKEIKEVKRRKERAKELEGIDLSNIVTSSRRRSTSTYVPPARVPKPTFDDESESDEDKSANKIENNDDETDDAKSTKKKNGQGKTNADESTDKEKIGDDADNLEGSKEKEEEEEQEVDRNDQEEDEEDADEDDDDDSESEDFNADEEYSD